METLNGASVEKNENNSDKFYYLLSKYKNSEIPYLTPFPTPPGWPIIGEYNNDRH